MDIKFYLPDATADVMDCQKNTPPTMGKHDFLVSVEFGVSKNGSLHDTRRLALRQDLHLWPPVDATIPELSCGLPIRISNRLFHCTGNPGRLDQSVLPTRFGERIDGHGVLFTEGKQHLAYHTLQHHVAPSCRSDFLYKAALQDKSRTVWRGMIKVDPEAQQTDGYQRNDNLLLSNQARSDSIPGLEIEADDVRCTHASTVGQIDQQEVFYLMARGIPRQTAIQMVVEGFFAPVMARIPIEGVRDRIASRIIDRVG